MVALNLILFIDNAVTIDWNPGFRKKNLFKMFLYIYFSPGISRDTAKNDKLYNPKYDKQHYP